MAIFKRNLELAKLTKRYWFDCATCQNTTPWREWRAQQLDPVETKHPQVSAEAERWYPWVAELHAALEGRHPPHRGWEKEKQICIARTEYVFWFCCSKVKLSLSSPLHLPGMFGTGILSYFSFLRFLVMLNLIIFMLVFSFIMLPIIIAPHASGNITYNQNDGQRKLVCLNQEHILQSGSIMMFS